MSVLSREDCDRFDRIGYLRVPAAFGRDEAEAMETRVWTAMSERHGIERDRPESWRGSPPTGMQDVREDPVFRAIGSVRTLSAIDQLLGRGQWRRPRQWGQFLIRLPDSKPSARVPIGLWHTDFGYVGDVEATRGLLAFSLITDVPPGAGGTAIVSGSHRLVRRYVRRLTSSQRKKMRPVRNGFLRSDDWWIDLSSTADDPERDARLTRGEKEIDGVPVEITEVCGRAGDVVLAHPWMIHTTSLNHTEQASMLCVQRIRVLDESLADSEA